ncbi:MULTISPECIES: phage tail protein I [unclassified Pseudomonas]|uniref:phage tail protein I n=1 Tax=unclassified Pseudomonas TaxID=196821 RepID=UPI0020978DBF|nr:MULTISPECIES: phage tail protein I [unclassified Pseudomonas]MCO7519180.1 phage tail protein I [Pseudomonas sp. 1]MCO7540134.1 phage tail protein I [Pseudomonas sp. VA159-2]
MKSLLPVNSTPLERAVEVATDEVIDVPLRTLYNPDTCPAHLLYQLAWAWSVDRWDDSWSDEVKRSVIRSSFFVHAHKGTLGALRRVVEPFGYLIEIVEWFRMAPRGVRGTFSLKVGVSNGGISDETYRELSALLDDAKPVSRHMIGLEISMETRGAIYIGYGLNEGDQLDVYPPALLDIEVTGAVGRGGRDHTIDSLDISYG